MKKLGSGSYGSVFYDSDTNSAVKRCYHEGNRRIWMGNLREIDILVRCGNHPNIVSIKNIKVFDDDEFNKVNLYMEKYDSNLHSFMKKYKEEQIEIDVIRKILVQIFLGLEYLHSHKIIHRDLKPDNILINPETLEVAICDFGMADINMKYQVSETKVTSPIYRAPEVFLKKKYSYEIDSWAVGIIFYKMLYQEFPFEYPDDTINKIEKEIAYLNNEYSNEKNNAKKNKIIRKIDDKKAEIDNAIYNSINVDSIRKRFRIKQSYHNLLLSLLEIDPRKRCSISQALSNQFFNSVSKTYIIPTRSEFPPSPLSLNRVFIEKIPERKWIEKYTMKFTTENRDLSCENLFPIVFHGLDLFERYLMFCKKNDNSKKTLKDGKYLNEQETFLYLYTCFYISHKYYSVSYYAYDFEDFFPEEITTDSTMEKAETFEMFLISNVVNYEIFHCTLYELEEEINTSPTFSDYYNLLKNYLHTTKELEQDIEYYTSYRAMSRKHTFSTKS